MNHLHGQLRHEIPWTNQLTCHFVLPFHEKSIHHFETVTENQVQVKNIAKQNFKKKKQFPASQEFHKM